MPVDVDSIDVLILCGGLGTRLLAAVNDRPKPMADVRGRPFLDLLLEQAEGHGFNRFILCAGHKAESIARYFTRKSTRKIEISVEPNPLGTAGAIKFCEKRVESRRVLVMNGDSICRVDLTELAWFHAEKKAFATVVAAPLDGRTDCGFMEISSDGAVGAFREKGAAAGSAPGAINAGIYVLEAEVLRMIPAGKACSLELDILPALAGKGLYAYRTGETVHDIGTPERLERFRQSR